MIAEILAPFQGDTLERKIDYQMKKVDEGVARELFNNSGDTLSDMRRNMSIVAGINDRVKSPYIEFILSSPVGENLSDEKFCEVAQEYMNNMGYKDSCYTVVKNEDKDHKHIHILATTIDFNGLWIDDSWSRGRSGKVMRAIEIKYDLEVMEKGKNSRNKTLGESQFRQYFFDTALHKGLRSHNAHARIKRVLEQSEMYKMVSSHSGKAYTNTEWRIMLGDETYENMLDVLEKGKFFNPLFKDELLNVMDRLYPKSKNAMEFREQLEVAGYYMRLVSDKGISHFVYGIPERGFYIKDLALPERYRFGKIQFAGEQMAIDEQKHYLYNVIFALLRDSANYEKFKDCLSKNNIELIEHVNSNGVYGISFAMKNVNEPETFNSSDISRRLTYQNLQDFFNNRQEQELDRESSLICPIEPNDEFGKIDSNEEQQGYVIEQENITSNKINPIEPILLTVQDWHKDINYMYPVTVMALNSLSNVLSESEPSESKKRRKDDVEECMKKKKKKKRNRGLSY